MLIKLSDLHGGQYEIPLDIYGSNLLINPDFKINQRGQSEYNSGAYNSYSVDRWTRSWTTIVIPQANGTVRVKSESVGSGITQYIENYSALIGKPVTFSTKIRFIEKPSDAVLRMKLYDGVTNQSSDTIILEDGVYSCTRVIKEGATGISAYWMTDIAGTAGNTPHNMIDYIIEWAKLEVGEYATPYIPPDYALELAKCQRYFRVSGINKIRNYSNIPNEFCFLYEYGGEMRTTPSVTINHLRVADDMGSTPVDGFNFSVGWATPTSCRIDATKSAHGMPSSVLCVEQGSIVIDAEMY